jgi:hypothetical protein
MRRHPAVIVAALFAGLAAAPGPEGGGAAGQAYREFFTAAGARDWRTLYRVTTPSFFQHLSQADLAQMPSPLPPHARLIVSGPAEGDATVLEVEIKVEDPGGARSSILSTPMRRRAGQWKVAYADTDDGGHDPVLAFEGAETVRRMRELAMALEGYRFRHDVYPKDAAALAASLSPEPLAVFPRADAWGNAFAYRVDPSLKGYLLISFGADGKEDAGIYAPSGVPKKMDLEITTDPKADIVVRSGFVFMRAPQGAVLD